MRRISIVVLMGMYGCVAAPMYPYAPENSVEVKRTTFGANFSIHNKADTDVDLQDCSYDPVTHAFKLGHATFKSAQSTNQEKLLAWMTAYQGQQREYANYRAVEWQGVNQFTSTIAGVVSPALNAAISGGLSVKAMKIMRPSLVDEATALISGGKVDPFPLLQSLPAEVSDGVRGNLAAKGLAVSSQPSK